MRRSMPLTLSGGRGGLIKAPWSGTQPEASTDSGGFGRAVALPRCYRFWRVHSRFYSSPTWGRGLGEGPHSCTTCGNCAD